MSSDDVFARSCLYSVKYASTRSLMNCVFSICYVSSFHYFGARHPVHEDKSTPRCHGQMAHGDNEASNASMRTNRRDAERSDQARSKTETLKWLAAQRLLWVSVRSLPPRRICSYDHARVVRWTDTPSLCIETARCRQSARERAPLQQSRSDLPGVSVFLPQPMAKPETQKP
jgi:hypothetical protein